LAAIEQLRDSTNDVEAGWDRIFASGRDQLVPGLKQYRVSVPAAPDGVSTAWGEYRKDNGTFPAEESTRKLLLGERRQGVGGIQERRWSRGGKETICGFS